MAGFTARRRHCDALYAGLRGGELTALRFEDIDFEKGAGADWRKTGAQS